VKAVTAAGGENKHLWISSREGKNYLDKYTSKAKKKPQCKERSLKSPESPKVGERKGVANLSTRGTSETIKGQLANKSKGKKFKKGSEVGGLPREGP